MSEYKVGYRKPPKNGQFKKGQSGNPFGRPRRQHDYRKLFEKEISDEILIKNGEIKSFVTKKEAIVMSIIHKALTGDISCMEHLIRIDSVSDRGEIQVIFVNYIDEETGLPDEASLHQHRQHISDADYTSSMQEIVSRLLDQEIQVSENKQKISITVREAIIKLIVKKAMKADKAALRIIMRWLPDKEFRKIEYLETGIDFTGI